MVIDTSILIEQIRKGSVIYRQVLEKARNGKVILIAPVIVLSELWGGKSIERKEQEDIIKHIIKPIKFIEIDEFLAKKAGELIRKYDVRGFDSIVAAVCVVNKARLATLNKKHFKQVKGLKFFDKI